MAYKNIKIPSVGEKISFDKTGKLVVPDNPIIPYIEGDGIGIDISPAMIAVVDRAVEVAYEGKKNISCKFIFLNINFNFIFLSYFINFFNTINSS